MNTTCVFKMGCCTSEALCCEASLWEERRHGSSEGEIPGQALPRNPLTRREVMFTPWKYVWTGRTSWNLSWICRNIMTKLPCTGMTQDLAGVSYPLASVYLHPSIGCSTEIPGPLPPEVEFHGWPSAVQCFQNLHDGGSVNSMDSVSMPWKEEPLGSGMVLAARFYRR